MPSRSSAGEAVHQPLAEVGVEVHVGIHLDHHVDRSAQGIRPAQEAVQVARLAASGGDLPIGLVRARQRAHPRMGAGQLRQQVRGRVGRTVVDHHPLAGEQCLSGQCGAEAAQVGLLVAGGRNHRVAHGRHAAARSYTGAMARGRYSPIQSSSITSASNRFAWPVRPERASATSRATAERSSTAA